MIRFQVMFKARVYQMIFVSVYSSEGCVYLKMQFSNSFVVY